MEKCRDAGDLIVQAREWLSMIGDVRSYSVRYKPGMIRMDFYLYRKVPENRVIWDCTVEQFAAFDHDTFDRCMAGFIQPIMEKEFVHRCIPQLIKNLKQENSNEIDS